MIENSRIDPAHVRQKSRRRAARPASPSRRTIRRRRSLGPAEVFESPCDSDFAADLFSHYPDLSYGEFADRLFGDEEAEPSDDFILAFARAAVEALEEIEKQKNGLGPTS